MVKLTDIIKTENIIKVSPESTLSQALAKLSSSHDAAFVFNEENQYLGVINPYYALIKSSLPGNAKVIHCLFHAPKVYADYSNAKVAQLMLESIVHYLPVFDRNENFLGIITARRLFSYLQRSYNIHITLGAIIDHKKHPLVSINENESMSSALNLFKKTKASKIVSVNNENKLTGILTYYDIIGFLMMPKQRLHRGEREGDKSGTYSQKVKNYIKTYIITMKRSDTASEALDLILEKKVGSVVVVDKDQHPLGIVTTRDFLKLCLLNSQGKKIELITRNLSQISRQKVGGFFNHLSQRIGRLPKVDKARLMVQEEKNGALFKVALSVVPKRGKPEVIHKEGRDLTALLKKIKKQ